MRPPMPSLGHVMRVAAAALLGLSALVSVAAANGIVLDEKRGVMTLAPVLEKAMPAVVNISVATRLAAEEPMMRDPFLRRFFGLSDGGPDREVMSAGSGVVVDRAKGYVITSHHVVANADRISVTVNDGRELEAKRVDSDVTSDLSLLRVEPAAVADLPADLPLGDSDALKVGDLVVAIGNPFGLGQTVTSGIVSAVGRAAAPGGDKAQGLIQTDAPINPGNSGGALINSKGELVGINTAMVSPSRGNVGIGFAMPSNVVKAAMQQLVKNGEARRGRTGANVRSVSPDLAAAPGVVVGTSPR
jgi:S1-C subfamily serine protease